MGALLLAAGLVRLLVAVWRGHGGQEEDSEDVDPDARTDWLTVGLLGAVLFVHVYAINLVGVAARRDAPASPGPRSSSALASGGAPPCSASSWPW